MDILSNAEIRRKMTELWLGEGGRDKNGSGKKTGDPIAIRLYNQLKDIIKRVVDAPEAILSIARLGTYIPRYNETHNAISRKRAVRSSCVFDQSKEGLKPSQERPPHLPKRSENEGATKSSFLRARRNNVS